MKISSGIFICLIFVIFIFVFPNIYAQKVLIIQDELPQMTVLEKFLIEKGKIDVQIVDQETLPANLSVFNAVIVYLHKKLFEPTELAIIDYTKNGGYLILLHHSISSGKAENKYYFDFLGIKLDNPKQSKDPVEPGGGYGWVHPITMTLVNLNKNHYITSNNIDWDTTIDYKPSDRPSVEDKYPAIVLDNTEVYMNHKFTDGREKTVLIGLYFFDKRNDKYFVQDRVAWIKEQGKGKIFYLMPGHSKEEFENENISQLVLNAVVWGQ
jgi:hypothetical protein